MYACAPELFALRRQPGVLWDRFDRRLQCAAPEPIEKAQRRREQRLKEVHAAAAASKEDRASRA